jgi:outer membrane lipoprotein-sorting protein
MKEVPGGGEMAEAMVGMKTIVISDGANVWMLNPMAGKVQLPADQAGQYRGQWHCKDYIPQNAEIVGSEVVNGRDCFVLAVKDEKSDYAKLWVDKRNYQLARLEGKPQQGETMIAIFSDFRKVTGGWEFPYKTEVYSGKEIASTVTVKSIDVNKGLKDDLFNADKVEGKAPDMQDMIKKMKEKMKDADKQ